MRTTLGRYALRREAFISITLLRQRLCLVLRASLHRIQDSLTDTFLKRVGLDIKPTFRIIATRGLCERVQTALQHVTRPTVMVMVNGQMAMTLDALVDFAANTNGFATFDGTDLGAVTSLTFLTGAGNDGVGQRDGSRILCERRERSAWTRRVPGAGAERRPQL